MIIDVSVNWYKDYSNLPRVAVHVAVEDCIGEQECPSYEIIHSEGDSDFLVAWYPNGYAAYGVYHRNPEDGPFLSKGKFDRVVNVEGVPTTINYCGYGASRPSVMNQYIDDPEKRVHDLIIDGKHNYSAAVSYKYLVEQLEPVMNEKGMWLFVDPKRGCLVPSLAPDRVKFREESEWKERNCGTFVPLRDYPQKMLVGLNPEA